MRWMRCGAERLWRNVERKNRIWIDGKIDEVESAVRNVCLCVCVLCVCVCRAERLASRE